MMKITYGPYKDMVLEEPEYEQLAAWGPVIDLRDVASSMMLSGTTDRLGLENNESGWLIGWIMGLNFNFLSFPPFHVLDLPISCSFYPVIILF